MTTKCKSLWLHPSTKPKKVEVSCFAKFPYFFESFEQYGVSLPKRVTVRWKPLRAFLKGFEDERDAAQDFIADVANMISHGEPVPPVLVDRRGALSDGRHRAWAAHSLGIKKAPVVVLPHKESPGPVYDTGPASPGLSEAELAEVLKGT